MPVPMEARGVGSLGAGVVGACVLPDKGADNWTRVFWKSIMGSKVLSTSPAPLELS